MYQITKKQVRSSTEVAFYSPATSTTLAEEHKRRFYEKYVLTGKQISVANEVSEDGLTQTTIAVWISEEAANEFLNDPEMVHHLNDWDAYKASTNITGNLVSKETV